MRADELLALPTVDLMARAVAIRDAAFGTRITYSPKVFIPLTLVWIVVIGTWMQTPWSLWK